MVDAGTCKLNLKYLALLWNGIVPVVCIELVVVVVEVSATLFLKLNVPVADDVSTIGLTWVTNERHCGNNSVSPVPISAFKLSPLNDPK